MSEEKKESGSKKAWFSKTFWTGIVVAIAPLWPPAAEWMAENPDTLAHVMGIVFTGLRLVTGDKVSVK
jgi:hypothetical protein